jgi:hypothetical protein
VKKIRPKIEQVATTMVNSLNRFVTKSQQVVNKFAFTGKSSIKDGFEVARHDVIEGFESMKEKLYTDLWWDDGSKKFLKSFDSVKKETTAVAKSLAVDLWKDAKAYGVTLIDVAKVRVEAQKDQSRLFAETILDEALLGKIKHITEIPMI